MKEKLLFISFVKFILTNLFSFIFLIVIAAVLIFLNTSFHYSKVEAEFIFNPEECKVKVEQNNKAEKRNEIMPLPAGPINNVL